MRLTLLGLIALTLAGGTARAGLVSVSHPTPTSILGSSAPLIQMQSVTISNNGTNVVFTIQFFNTTIEGPSSGNADAVYGFFNLDTDKNKATGLGSAALNGPEGGFGQYTDSRLGVDAYISFSSEGDAFGHSFTPGLVDLVRASNSTIIDTVAITYGSHPGSLTFTLSVADFSTLPGFSALQAGATPDFSVIVGNANSATDVLSSVTTTAVPEPGAIFLMLQASAGLVLTSTWRTKRIILLAERSA